MPFRPRISVLQSAFILLSAATVFLAGCGITGKDGAGPVSTPGVAVKGSVHGGVYPIQGATIRLMETQSNGYGGTARQLLQTTSDNNGYFTFPDTGWTCDAGQYAYITVSSGHTASNATNNNVIQVGVIGGCSTDLATTAEIDAVNVFVSELSTVAAAYALGNFVTIDSSNASTGGQIVNISAPGANNTLASGCTGLGASMVCSANGLGHGFANAYNLVDSVRYDGSFPTGQARTTIPNNSQGTVPQALIDSLGNILQSCVDSPGVSNGSAISGSASDGSHCGDLFEYATPAGGTTPMNTLQVAMNMAKNPTNNVSSLFGLQPRAAFFTPDMSTAPGNLSISVFYTGAVVGGNATTMPTPVDVALDASDNVYVLYGNGTTTPQFSAVDVFGPDGTTIAAGAHNTSALNPYGIAVGSDGNAWVTDNSTAGNLWEVSATGTFAPIPITVTGGHAAGVALDRSNNVWVSRDSTAGQTFFRYDSTNSYASTVFYDNCITFFGGTTCTTYTPSLRRAMRRIQIDSNQNLWGVTFTDSPVVSSAFAFPYGNDPNTDAVGRNLDTYGGFGVAVTNSLTAYFPLPGILDSAAGNTQNGITRDANGSYSGGSATGGTYSNSMGVAIDGNGAIYWTDNETVGQLFQMTPGSDGTITTGTLISTFPCYPMGGSCYAAAASNLRSIAIDSSGAIWYVADSTAGVLIQTLGLAAPTWPLISFAESGVPVSYPLL